MFRLIYNFAKHFLLFPITFAQSVGWFFWSVIFGGLYPGCAPIFINGDRFVLYLKRLRLKYCVIKYDIVNNIEQIIYVSRIPVEQYRLRSDNVLACYSYSADGIKYIEIKPDEVIDNMFINEYTLNTSSRRNVICPYNVCIISIQRICADSNCYYQIFKTTTLGKEIIESNLINFVVDMSVSNDGRFVAFSTKNGIYINDIMIGKQLFFEMQNPKIYNWDDNSNLLIYYEANGEFVILDAISSKRKVHNIPDEYNNVFNASISPKGNYIAYYYYSKHSISESDRLVLLMSTKKSDYKILLGMAKVFAIDWSSNERYVSIAGVNERDMFDISYNYKMRNATNHDKVVVNINDGSIVRCPW